MLRRALTDLRQTENPGFVRSHQIAAMCGSEAAQMRRDLMTIGAKGHPGHGYSVTALSDRLESLFEGIGQHKVAVVGLGNLGRALIEHFHRRYERMSVVALFDNDPEKTGRVLHGIRSFPMDQFRQVARDMGISIAVLAVPDSAAQQVADQLVAGGVTGILNFGPLSLRVPESVQMDNVDITAALDRLAFFSRKQPAAEPAPNEVKSCRT